MIDDGRGKRVGKKKGGTPERAAQNHMKIGDC
jgi:hypothetical protein